MCCMLMPVRCSRRYPVSEGSRRRLDGAKRGRILGFLEDGPQAARQVSEAERFVDDRKLADRSMPLHHVPRIARSEQDFDVFVPLSGFAGKLDAIHSVWHHDIAEQELK